LNLLAEVQRTGDYLLFIEKWAWTFLSFLHYNHGFDLRFCAKAPMIDPVSGLLFVFGLLLALCHPKLRVTWLLLSGLLFGMMANALAIQGQNPDATYVNGQRYFIVVPFLFLSCAWTLDWVFQRFAGLAGRGRALGLLLLGGGAILSLAWNSHFYYRSFRDFKKTDAYWGCLGFNHIDVAEYLNLHCPRHHAIVDGEYVSSVVEVLTRMNFPINPLDPNLAIPIERAVDRDILIITLRWNHVDLQEKIRQWYPNARWDGVPDPKGKVDLVGVFISKEDIQALQKGRALGRPFL
jgi:hypothetical protein